MGPGKAALMEAIERAGPISGAGRALGMSYRRAWLLVDAMNRCWSSPLVETAAGGMKGGGARVTDAGRVVLAHYRALEASIEAAAQADGQAMAALVRQEPLPPKA